MLGTRPSSTRALGVGLLIALLGCGDDDAGSARPDAGGEDAGVGPTGHIEYELFDNTRVLDEDTLDALVEVEDDLSVLTFEGGTELLDSLEPPNVILAGVSEMTPAGLLRKVTSVEMDGSRVLVHTEPSTVFHAFRRLDVELEGPFTSEPHAADDPVRRELGLAREALEQSVTIGDDSIPLVVFDGDGQASTGEDRVAGDGSLTATVTFRFWLRFDWEDKSVDEAFSELGDLLEDVAGLFTGQASLAELLNLRTGFTVEGALDAGLDLHGESSLGFEKEVPLGSQVLLPPITIGPLVFVPRVSLLGRVTGGITGELDLGFGVGASAGAGFSFDADDGVPEPITIGPDFTFQEPSATVTTLAAVRSDLELMVSLRLYDLMGPYASLIAYGNVDLDRTRDPCFQLTAGLEARTGAVIGVFGYDLATFTVANIPIGDPVELSEGDCTEPPEPVPTDAVITPWSRSYADTVWTTGTDEAFANLERTHDGRLLVTSDGTDVVLKVDEAGDVIWARRFEEPARPTPALRPQHAIATLSAGVLVATRENVLLELDAAGELLRARQLETDNDEPGFRAAKQIAGDVWLAGTHRPDGTMGSDDRQAWLVVLAPSGDVKHSFTWGSPDFREAVRAILPLADGALLVGDAGDFTNDSQSFALRVDAEGEVLWAKMIQGCERGRLIIAEATESDDGNLLLGGWFYATHTRALLMRLPPDGSGSTPAWATETSIEPILGLEVSAIHQLSTGELRVAGSWATTGTDKVFLAGTDSIGRFAWLRWYGGDAESGAPALHVTEQGGLLLASASAVVEAQPGGLWLFEVPMLDGAISFAEDSPATSETLAFESASSCVMTPDADLDTSPLPVELSDVIVDASADSPAVTEH